MSPRNAMGQGLGLAARTQGLQLLLGGGAPAPPWAPGPRASGVDAARAGVGGSPAGDTGLRCPDPAPRSQGARPLSLGMRAPSPPRPASSAPSSSRPPPRPPTSPLCSSALKNLLTQHFEQILEVFGPDNLPVAREVGHGGDAGGGPLDPSAGALDVERFSRKGCGRRLRPIARETGHDPGQPRSWRGLPRRQRLYPARPRPRPRRWPRPTPAHLGGPAPRPCIAAAPRVPRPVDLVPRAGPGFARGRDSGRRATGGGGRPSAGTGLLRRERAPRPGRGCSGLGSRGPSPGIRFAGYRPFPG